MIGYLKGKITHLFKDCCFLDVNGVGYRLFVSASTRQHLIKDTEIVLFTYLSVREDALLLYGFFSQQEYDLFLQLTSVSGIGPKVALNVLSAIAPADFMVAVSCKDLAVLTRLPGIGKKTAERIVLELKDKFGDVEALTTTTTTATTAVRPQNDAVQALQALGYSQPEIMSVLNKIPESATVETCIKLALKELSGR